MKRDVNDDLFSRVKRQNHTVCQKCLQPHALQCCHIFSRKYYSTRFNEDNAVVLCYSCHDWLDTHKISACLWNEEKRVFNKDEEAYHFLVEYLGYTWDQLIELYHMSRVPFRGYKHKKKDISIALRAKLNEE